MIPYHGLRVEVSDDDKSVRYEIERPGYGLPPHVHALREDYHDITALTEGVIVWGDGWFRELQKGETFTGFDPARIHAISAQGPAAWVNYYPMGSKNMGFPEGVKSSTLDSRVDIPDGVLNKTWEAR